MMRLKNFSKGMLLLIFLLVAYILYANRSSTNMTTRQKITKAFYPALMWVTKLAGVNAASIKNKSATPTTPLYTLQASAIDGTVFDFGSLKGSAIMIVNTASDCGYTEQYAGLEKLYQQYNRKLIIIAFPANDFKEQEKGNDHNIAAFCKENYGVTFPIMSKSVVIKTAGQNVVFKWLTDPAQNGWNSKAPSWNFSKYLINSKGQLTHYFDPGISPLSNEIIQAVEESKP